MQQDRTIDCVVCGSCVADVLVRPFCLDTPIGGGRTIEVDPIEVATGGLVSNSGVAMSRLGMKVAAIGCVGDDQWASFIRRELVAQRIDVTRLATHPTAPTTTAVALIDPGGERSFAYCPGATRQFDRSAMIDSLDLFTRSRMMLIGYYSLLPKLENDLPELLEAVRRRGCRTAMDAGADGGGMSPLDRILPHLDVYVPSHGEAVHQTGQTDPRAILDVFRSFGATALVGVKLGSQGALLSPASGEYVKIDAVRPPGPVLDTTGAGDCFYAGLITGLLNGLTVEQSGRLAAACGACCVTAVGATTGVADYVTTARLAGLE